jgi:hypothetical protein
MYVKNPPFSPFHEIALCLSGGGYRATSFHLGSLSYLNRISFNESNLLQHVKAISTVSGSTFTGVMYALMVQRGKYLMKSIQAPWNHFITMILWAKACKS